MDAYRVTVAETHLEARDTARQRLARPPAWVSRLMALRNAIVTPLGLQTGRETQGHMDRIGMFPIESATDGRLVMGFEDEHLDFRVVIDVLKTAGDSVVTATSLVWTHNLFGRVYLAVILPFHRLIVRASLQGWRLVSRLAVRRLARSSPTSRGHVHAVWSGSPLIAGLVLDARPGREDCLCAGK